MDPADEPSDPSGVDYSTVNRPRKAKLAVLQQREKDKNKEEDAEEDGYSSDSTSSSSREDHRTRIGTTKSRKQFVKEIKKRKKRRPNNSSDEDYGDFVQIAGTEKNVLYCICRKPNDPNVPMIFCDYCQEWYHLKCMGLDPDKTQVIKRYKCNVCKERESEEKRIKKLEQEAAQQAQLLKPARNKCRLVGCKNFARANSKYCKDTCGMEVTRQILRNNEILFRIQQDNKRVQEVERIKKIFYKTLLEFHLLDEYDISSIFIYTDDQLSDVSAFLPAEYLQSLSFHLSCFGNDFKEIDKLKNAITTCNDTVLQLKHKKLETEQYIYKISCLRFPPQPFVDDKKGAEIIDCFSCGHPIVSKRFLKHLDQCTLKSSTKDNFMLFRTAIDDTDTVTLCNFFDPRTRYYCSQLKANCRLHQDHLRKQKIAADLICGYLLDEKTENYCKYSKKDCRYHANWEKLKLSDCVQQIVAQISHKQFLEQEIQLLETAIINREKAVNSIPNHTTINT